VASDLGLEYRLGDHKAAKLAELLVRADVWAVTELPDATVESIFFRPCSGLQAAVDDALRTKGPGARVLVIMDAAATVPLLSPTT
jgi:nickel-dependent lactate racemase